MTSTPETSPTLEDQAATDGAATSGTEAESAPPEAVPSLPPIDEAAARELALAALHEITPDATIGEPADASVDADGVLTLRFANRMAGYPGWFWTVSLAQVEHSAPTVLEVELTPGEGALTAPEWLPWAERLAEYEAAQAALAAEGLVANDDHEDDDEDEDLDDVDDLDALDFDNDGSPILHSGDVDGVDIDELAEDAESEPADEDDESDEDDDDLDEDDLDEDDEDEDDLDNDADEDEDDEDSDEEELDPQA